MYRLFKKYKACITDEICMYIYLCICLCVCVYRITPCEKEVSVYNILNIT